MMETTIIPKMIVKRTFDWKENRTGLVKVPNDFFDYYIEENDCFEDIPIGALRVIFNILSIAGNEQFLVDRQPEKLTEFENKFETENHIFVRFKIKNSKISPTGTTHQIVETYKFLESYKLKVYQYVNSQGKKITAHGGLVTQPNFDLQGYTTFLVNSFWLRKIIAMSPYNHISYNLIYKLKNKKHVYFVLWLNKVQDLTELRLSFFNKKFGLEYKNSNDFCTKFLSKVKKSLTEVVSISFTYSHKNGYIKIRKTLVKHTEKSSHNEHLDMQRSIKVRMSYFQKRFKVTDENFKKFKEEYRRSPRNQDLLEKTYIQFVKNCRLDKTPSTHYHDLLFIKQIQEIMIEKYRETLTGQKHPNGYPPILPH